MFSVTYDIVTPESAEHGDAAERGWVHPGGWHSMADDPSKMSLREAIDLVGCLQDVGGWFVETDGRVDYRTGAEETRSLHPPRNITPASYGRLQRVLKARP